MSTKLVTNGLRKVDCLWSPRNVPKESPPLQTSIWDINKMVDGVATVKNDLEAVAHPNADK